MKKLLLPLAAVATLGVLASTASASVHWGVKCEQIAKLKLRKGVDCAHTLKKGQHWNFPKGVWFEKNFTTSGAPLSVKFQMTAVGGQGSVYGIGPGGKYGQLFSGEAPYSVYANQSVIVVAATRKFG